MTFDGTPPQLVLQGDTDVVIQRNFAHPPAKVWRALTEPQLIRLWLAPGDAMTHCEMDARAGGSFRYEWPEFHFSGPILDARAPHHMVHVEHFNGDTTSGPTVTTDLVAQGNGTRMTVVMRYKDAEARATAIEQGFTDGIEDTYGRISDLVLAD